MRRRAARRRAPAWRRAHRRSWRAGGLRRKAASEAASATSVSHQRLNVVAVPTPAFASRRLHRRGIAGEDPCEALAVRIAIAIRHPQPCTVGAGRAMPLRACPRRRCGRCSRLSSVEAAASQHVGVIGRSARGEPRAASARPLDHHGMAREHAGETLRVGRTTLLSGLEPRLVRRLRLRGARRRQNPY